MTTRTKTYDPENDFLRVRDFLKATYAQFPFPCNWGLERWNYARYFVAPMLGAYGTEDGTPEGSLKAIRLWEDLVRIWEDDAGEIVGVTCIEHPDPKSRQYGEIFLQRHPERLDLLEEMIVFGEETYVNPDLNRVYIWAYDDDANLIGVIRQRGFARREEPCSHHLEYVIGDLPPQNLPEGFRLQSMADENDIEKRREIFGRGFNHEDPKDWPSAFAYKELQKAPDYHFENDLVIIAPDGTYVACCLVWYDDVNRVAHLEPLGTHPDYRRKGLATQIQLAALRRAKNLGATRMPMTGGFEPFYRAFGFEERRAEHPWVKEF
jgi:predicted N-acetyltransferase YhbS